MIYINGDNIFACHFSSYASEHIDNDTGYLPLRVHNDTLLLSDGRLYKITCDNILSVLKINQSYDYVVDSADFTDKFAKINSEYYKIDEMSLCKIPIIANNSHNIGRIECEHDEYYYYYYVNVNNELVFFDEFHKSEQYKILDSDVNLIFVKCYYEKYYVIYTKNNTIIYFNINNFTQLTDSHIVKSTNKFIIKLSNDFLLDSRNDLYQLISDNKKLVLEKISDGVIDLYYDSSYVHFTDTESRIYRINRYCNSKKYIGVGNFGKPCSNTKSANNIYKQICQ